MMTAYDVFKTALLDVGVIKKGSFTLSSGVRSDFYADFRVLLGYPRVLKLTCDVLGKKIKEYWECEDYDLFCGIPFGGLIHAILLSNRFQKPLIFTRGKKSHGTQRGIEGIFKKNQKVIIIDDVITSGETISRVIDILKEKDLEVLSVLTILDRQDFGTSRLKRHGIPLYSIFKLSDFQ
jgi:uridine monophosphate synthetase